MKILDISYDEPEKNINLDEELLNDLDKNPTQNTCRFWESPTYFVVLGLAKKEKEDVHIETCKRDNIPIVRRCSGGGTVLQGPGCLNYALILKITPEIDTITKTNSYILNKLKISLESEQISLKIQGITDITHNGKKISGNAQRRKRNALLFHGTVLYNFNIKKCSKYLKTPPVKPLYRNNKKHEDFMINLNISPDDIKKNLTKTWKST